MTIDGMTIDHLRFLRVPRYAARVRAKVELLMAQSGLQRFDVLHEVDDSCCRREPWPVTAAHLFGPIVAAIAGVNAGNVVAQWAEHEPEVVVVAGEDSS